MRPARWQHQCLAWSDEMYQASGFPTEVLGRGRRPFDAMRTEVMAGQYLDTLEQVRGTGTREAALRVMRYKSAKYSVERPLHIGAALAGAGPEMFEALSAFGLPLGEAFQLRDDLLGVFGDPAVTGKPAGDDLVEGKRTVLVALALEHAPAEDARRLDESLGTPLDTAEVDALRQVIESSGAHTRVEQLIDELTARCLSALDAAAVTDTARSVLRQLAMAATQRVV